MNIVSKIVESKALRIQVLFDIYSRDKSFVDDIHKCGRPYVADCVGSSIENISNESEFYVVNCDEKIAGFFCINRAYQNVMNVMEGFHILPEYREAGFVSSFWFDVIQKMGGRPTAIGIYEQNEPAIKHLKKNEFKEMGSVINDGKNHIILVHYF